MIKVTFTPIGEKPFIRKFSDYETWQRIADHLTGTYAKIDVQEVHDTEKHLTLDDLLEIKELQNQPLIYCLCGSTDKAHDAFINERERLTLEGQIVLTIGVDKRDCDLDLTDTDIVTLNICHLWKIDLADVVRILNIGQYIGVQTGIELEYAKRRLKQNKLDRIEFLEEPIIR